WRDPRVWLGVAITLLTLWLALRGVDPRVLARDLARANLPLVLALSVPAYAAVIWLRALGWRGLAVAVAPLASGPPCRAAALGCLADHLSPLRMGEIVRAWALAREQRLGVAPILGTIVLERVIDGLVVIAMALAIF